MITDPKLVIIKAILEQISGSKYDSETGKIEFDGRIFIYKPNMCAYYEYDKEGNEINKFFENKMIEEFKLQISPEDKANSGLAILTFEDFMNLKVGKTFEQCMEFSGIQDRWGKDLIDSIYKNIYPYTLEHLIGNANSKEYFFLHFEFWRDMRKNDEFMYYHKDDEINILKDLSKISLDYINFCKGNIKKIVSIYGKGTYISGSKNFKNLVKDFPDMEWLDAWKESVGEYEPRYCKNNESKFIKLAEVNPFFHAYCIEIGHDSIGNFDDISRNDDNYLAYVLDTYYDNFANMKDMEEIRELVNNLAKDVDINYIKDTVNTKLKNENNITLESDLLDDISKNLKDKISNKDGFHYDEMSIEKITQTIINLFENNFIELYDYDKDLFSLCVRKQKFDEVPSNVALLMDKQYQERWEKENGETLNNDN